MNEVKSPKKPLLFYYCIALGLLMLFIFLVLPHFIEAQVKEVDYGTFMSMTEEGNIGRVEVRTNKIIFTDKGESTVYKTGLMNDPTGCFRAHCTGPQDRCRACREPAAEEQFA